MGWFNIIWIAVGLAMDAFAVSIAAGLIIPSVTSRHVFRIAFHFGLFQFMMPILGWLAGSTLSTYITAYDHWVVFALLTAIGTRMILGVRSGEEEKMDSDPSKGWMLVGLSTATSIDALAVGISMALLQVSVWFPAAIIGLVAATFSTVGIVMAKRLLHRWQTAATAVGGIVLILLGIKILAVDLFASSAAATTIPV